MVLNILDKRGDHAAKTVPGTSARVRIMTDVVPEINTGGERRVLNPKAKQA